MVDLQSVDVGRDEHAEELNRTINSDCILHISVRVLYNLFEKFQKSNYLSLSLYPLSLFLSLFLTTECNT